MHSISPRVTVVFPEPLCGAAMMIDFMKNLAFGGIKLRAKGKRS